MDNSKALDWQKTKRACLERLAKAPEDKESMRTLFQSLYALLDYRAAAKQIGQYERLHGLNLEDLFLKGQIAQHLNAVETAFQAFEECLRLNPNHLGALRGLAQLCLSVHEFSKSIEYTERALAIDADEYTLDSAALFNRQYLDGDPKAEASRIKKFARHLADIPALPDRPISPNSEKLRVAYVSSDFRFHPTYYFIEGVLRCHDRERFEIHCFHTMDRIDLKSRELASLTDHWYECGRWSDEAIALKIRENKIDLLIDLTGHMNGARPLLFAYQAAPLQGIWIGWLCPMGLTQCDFRISDWQADPDENEDSLYDEQVVRLEEGIFTFKLPEQAPEVSPPPCLQSGTITFGSFNNSRKQNDSVLQLWAQVLQAVPNSRLVLKHNHYNKKRARESSLKVFQKAGIAPDRILIVPGSSKNSEHLQSYAQMDIALDPFPYNGVTSTCEALAMGLPVIVIRGRHHRSRIGCSLLTQLGHPEWIADDVDTFVQIAVDLATDTTRLAHLRSRLRSELVKSPLGNPKSFTKSLETGLLKLANQARN